jgi:MoxR-like ATPase
MNLVAGDTVTIPAGGRTARPTQHLFDADSIDAIDAALAAGRPLLVRGEPGIGKSQLALAAALHLNWAFVAMVIDAHSESRDLLSHYDAVARLAEAQLQSVLPEPSTEGLRRRLELGRYIRPGPLWWAFDWDGAKRHIDDREMAVDCDPPPQPAPECRADKGCVFLIDDIDKAESDLPNGLLEALGAGHFPVQGLPGLVEANERPTLVMVTTNEERTLPDAFLRRCLVLHLDLPDVAAERQDFIDVLVARGRVHFDGRANERLLVEAAEQLAGDRQTAQQAHWLPLPGQAEYLDLVRAVLELAGGDWADQEPVLARIKRFLLEKHPQAATRARRRARDTDRDVRDG